MIKTIDAILAINPNAKVKVSEGSERNMTLMQK